LPILVVENDSVLPQLLAKRLADRRITFSNHRAKDNRCGHTIRKSIPFVWALLIGTLAGAFVAGFALFATHS
jgi:hypothetical protein